MKTARLSRDTTVQRLDQNEKRKKIQDTETVQIMIWKKYYNTITNKTKYKEKMYAES